MIERSPRVRLTREDRGAEKSEGVHNWHSYSLHIMQPLCGPANGSALLRSAVSADRDWTGRRTYLLCQVDWTFDTFTRLIHTSRPVSDRQRSAPQSHMVAASDETRMTAHNEGRVSDVVQIICESSRWSHRSGTLLNHDGRTARYLRAGQTGAQFAE